MIRFFSEDIPFVLKDKRKISAWLKEVSSISGHRIGDINYIFCSDEYILDINKRFLAHEYYTDIITFDNSDDYFLEKGKSAVCADIFISIDTVRANAAEYGESFETELKRVIVHGLLHLIGYDDTTDSKQKKMRSAENKALKLYDK